MSCGQKKACCIIVNNQCWHRSHTTFSIEILGATSSKKVCSRWKSDKKLWDQNKKKCRIIINNRYWCRSHAIFSTDICYQFDTIMVKMNEVLGEKNIRQWELKEPDWSLNVSAHMLHTSWATKKPSKKIMWNCPKLSRGFAIPSCDNQ